VRERHRRTREARPDVLDLRVPPAVDRLLRVADDGDVAEVFGRDEADEVELDPVRVLELVHDQVTEALATPPAELRHAL